MTSVFLTWLWLPPSPELHFLPPDYNEFTGQAHALCHDLGLGLDIPRSSPQLRGPHLRAFAVSTFKGARVVNGITQSVKYTQQNEAASSACSAGKKQPTASENTSVFQVLWELRNLLEEYSPAWYTDGHRIRLESALCVGQNESNQRIEIMCFERTVLLQHEQTAWNEFRRVRNLKSSSDSEIVRSHDMAIETSRRLRDHFAACEECKGCKRI